MKPQNPSALHILAFVYLTFSHVTDGELSHEEIDTIARVLHGWLPDATSDQISRVIVDTAAWVNGIASDEERLAQAETYAHLMKEQMSEKQRSAVLVNLIELARADGKITATEEQFIGHLTRTLGLA
ncbi:TerB family tellurite resistance protein [Nannocystis pusilla]|uniref:TerB family tellurite resistance protein n=1 Tax=Nannocystis pusilla TaxID=889268 RepID=A0A9X3IWN7_9BACT|nr:MULTISPECIES: TerB family tellurite resistance protein [Nannocystis]MCY0994162.1 TerB family tellurite resistance protein [Nannocystis sp. ILAH1]MCY1004978.1 TerB family tellurite resistance protein [Nannocystis pusilla]MCY1063943.1 TerB family tellurite resistance protein [Nannocystis sp. RBIL2]